MGKRSKYLTLMGACLMTSPVLAADATLVAVYGDFITPPAFIRGSDTTPHSGYLIDIYRDLSQQLGMQLELKAFRRADIAGALLKSAADVYCRANPAWYPEPLLRWSPPLFAYADVLLSHQPMEDLQGLAQRKALVATTSGYKYPELEPFVSSRTFNPTDYSSPEEAASAFLAGKTDTVVMSEIEAHYFTGEPAATASAGTLSLHCVYSPRLKPLQRQLLDNYISARASQGDFKALLQKYSWQLEVQPAAKGL